MANLGGQAFDILSWMGIDDSNYQTKLLGAKASAAQTAQTIDRSLNVALLAGATAFTVSTAAAMKFESSFAGVTKTVDGLRDAEGKLNEVGLELAQGFRDLALEIPVSVNELNKIGELGGQLGIAREDLLGFTDTIAKMGVTTNLTTEAAATAMARFVNVTKAVAPAGLTAAEQIERIGSTVVDLGNNFATTEAEIAEMAQRLAGAGSQIGLTQDEILGFSAALSSVGIAAEAGGSAFSRVMVDMASSVASGGAKLDAFAKTAKMTVPEFSQLFKEDASEALLAFVKGLDETSKSGGNTFGVLEELGLSNVRVRDALLRASGASNLFTDAIKTASVAYKENNALTKEAAQRFATTESQLILLKNVFNDAFISMGNDFLPTIKSITDILTENPAIVQAVIKSVGTLAITFGSLAAAIKVVNLVSAMNPLIAGIIAVTAATVALHKIMEARQILELKAIEAISDEVDEVEKLEAAYDRLAISEDPEAKKEMKLIVEQLATAYGLTKDEVEKLITKEGELTGIYRERRLAELKKEYEELALVTRTLGQQSLETADQLERAGIATDNLGASLDLTKLSTDEYIKTLSEEEKKVFAAATATDNHAGSLETLDPKLVTIKNEIAELEAEMTEANITTDEATKKTNNLSTNVNILIDVQKLLSDAGIKTTESYQKQISELETLVPLVEGDALASEQLTRKLSELYNIVGDTGKWLDLKMASDDVKDSLEQAGVVVGDVRIGMVELQKAQPTSKTFSWIEILGSKFKPISDDIGSYTHQMLGAIDSMGFMSKEAGDLTSSLISLATGSIDPLTFGLSALTTVWSLLSKSDYPESHARSLDQVKESLSYLGIEVDANRERFEGWNEYLNSDFLAGLQFQIDFYVEQLKYAEGETRKNFESMIEQYQAMMDQMLQAFDLGGRFDEISEGLDWLLEEVRNKLDYFGDAIDKEGLGQLLLDQFVDATAILAELDPNTQAYEDLASQLYETYLQMVELGVGADWARINLGVYGLSVQDLADIFFGFDDTVEVTKTKLGDVEKKLGDVIPPTQELADKTIVLADNMKKLSDDALPVRDIFKDTSDASDVTQKSFEGMSEPVKKITKDFQNLGDDALPVVRDVFKDTSEAIDETTESLKFLKFQWEDTINSIIGNFDTFESDMQDALDLLDQITFFDLDLDTTNVDEALQQMLIDMLAYLNTLNPGSPAWLAAKQGIDELIARMQGLGIPIPLEVNKDPAFRALDEVEKRYDDLKQLMENTIYAKINSDNAFSTLGEIQGEYDLIKQNMETEILTNVDNIDAKKTVDDFQTYYQEQVIETFETALTPTMDTESILQEITDIDMQTEILRMQVEEAMIAGMDTEPCLNQIAELEQKQNTLRESLEQKSSLNIETETAKQTLQEFSQQNETMQDLINAEMSLNLDNQSAEKQIETTNMLAESMQETIETDMLLNVNNNTAEQQFNNLISSFDSDVKSKIESSLQMSIDDVSAKNKLTGLTSFFNTVKSNVEQNMGLSVNNNAAKRKIAEMNNLIKAINTNVDINLNYSEKNRPPAMHTGGRVNAHNGEVFSDEVVRVLQRGEVVINEQAANTIPEYNWNEFNRTKNPDSLGNRKMEAPQINITGYNINPETFFETNNKFLHRRMNYNQNNLEINQHPYADRS